MATYKSIPVDTLSEAEWQSWIVDLATWLGWRVFHPRPAQIAGRWATHLLGSAGFPDLTMVHQRRGFLIVEVKSNTGRVTPGQRAWLADLEEAGVECYVWRPKDYREVEARLKEVQR